jgi:hypothetical protein
MDTVAVAVAVAVAGMKEEAEWLEVFATEIEFVAAESQESEEWQSVAAVGIGGHQDVVVVAAAAAAAAVLALIEAIAFEASE